jgi:predicted phosphodiesterase
MDAAFGDVQLLVFGHSHIPWDTTTPGGLRLLNPGSPTDRRRQPHHTYMTIVIDDSDVREATIHTL